MDQRFAGKGYHAEGRVNYDSAASTFNHTQHSTALLFLIAKPRPGKHIPVTIHNYSGPMTPNRSNAKIPQLATPRNRILVPKCYPADLSAPIHSTGCHQTERTTPIHSTGCYPADLSAPIRSARCHQTERMTPIRSTGCP